jgi:hypothetical protein
MIAISSLLILVGTLTYVHSIVYGQTRPHRTTRFVLLVITCLSASSLWAGANRGAAFWLAAISTVQALGLFLLCLKRGMGGWSRSDITCLLIAAAGIVLWQVTDQPMVGLLASILADFVGCVPAIIKTYRLPHTEIWQFFAIDTVAAAIGLAASVRFDIFTLSYPLYIFTINAAMVVLIVRGQQTTV